MQIVSLLPLLYFANLNGRDNRSRLHTMKETMANKLHTYKFAMRHWNEISPFHIHKHKICNNNNYMQTYSTHHVRDVRDTVHVHSITLRRICIMYSLRVSWGETMINSNLITTIILVEREKFSVRVRTYMLVRSCECLCVFGLRFQETSKLLFIID